MSEWPIDRVVAEFGRAVVDAWCSRWPAGSRLFVHTGDGLRFWFQI